MNLSRREMTGGTAFLVVLTAVIGYVCVQTRTPSVTPITFREAGAATIPPSPVTATTPVPDASAVPSMPAPVNGTAAPATTENTPLPATGSDIVVHVTGAVKKPGVYHLAPGARGDDALKAAGGPTKDANPDALNLAAHLEDGSQIHVPTHKEKTENAAPAPDSFIKHDTGVTPKKETKPTASTAAKSKGHAGHSGRGSGKLTADSGITININTADATTLQKLPGIGPSMADRILDYRKANGGFKNPEELMEVSGIGPKKFAKMEAIIKVK